MDKLLKAENMPFDMRAEVLARILAERYDLSTEQILFRPTHYFQRWGRSDVLEVYEGFSQRTEKELLWLDVSREAMFDALPESIFLHPDDSYGDYISRIKKLSEQEAQARKFLLPFEQLFGWLRLENEMREHADENNTEAWWQGLAINYQPTANSLSAEQQQILTQMQPFLSDILGNWTLTAEWLSLFLETDITIHETPPPMYPLPVELQKRLGEGVLGQDFVIGTVFSDGIPGVNICFDNPAPDDIAGYLPGGKNRDILDGILLNYLLPVETPYAVAVKVPELGKKAFQLGEQNANSILGYTTYFER